MRRQNYTIIPIRQEIIIILLRGIGTKAYVPWLNERNVHPKYRSPFQKQIPRINGFE